jgi:hypothetical protein
LSLFYYRHNFAKVNGQSFRRTSNNIVCVCKSFYFEYLINEIGINSNISSNTTYKPTSFATRVNSFRIFLLSLFYYRHNFAKVNGQSFRRTSWWCRYASFLKSRSYSQVSSIKTFDFSTINTTLPHDKLKTRLKETIHKVLRLFTRGNV